MVSYDVVVLNVRTRVTLTIGLYRHGIVGSPREWTVEMSFTAIARAEYVVDQLMKLSNGCDHRIPLTDPHHIRTPRHERRATVSESPVERQAPVLIV